MMEMLLIKSIASSIIITSSTLLGNNYASMFSKRVESLIKLQDSLRLLESEVVYTMTPLPQALLNVSKKSNQDIGFIFKEIKEHLLSEKSNTIEKSFKEVFYKYKNKLAIKKEDIEIILTLAKSLGNYNNLEEQKYFESAIKQLITKQKEAEHLRDKNMKLYRSLGISIGLGATILLF